MYNQRAPFYQGQGFDGNYYDQAFGYQNFDPYNNQTGPVTQGSPQPPSTPYQYFAKPQHPTNWFPAAQPVQGGQSQNWSQTQKGIMTYFQDKDGQVDIDKMLSTVGQMANTYHQVSPIVKGIGSFVKGFK
ncbi:YppG family protein [Aquibacillus rhizosphaerae]|uniref:YppG family protein n=1 Tax=Aquibacillus rhizosphaerae TaxID=3051431 RepID=A0ABT7L2R8_9BACI|nr:YppG family protein [Aquibacillus sp. LR5S19]MDL4840144.1 YppG family protein [Aquibacillus sp. LR5S19]